MNDSEHNDRAIMRSNEQSDEEEDKPLLRAIHTQNSLISVSSSRFGVETPRLGLAQLSHGMVDECKRYVEVVESTRQWLFNIQWWIIPHVCTFILPQAYSARCTTSFAKLTSDGHQHHERHRHWYTGRGTSLGVGHACILAVQHHRVVVDHGPCMWHGNIVRAGMRQ